MFVNILYLGIIALLIIIIVTLLINSLKNILSIGMGLLYMVIILIITIPIFITNKNLLGYVLPGIVILMFLICIISSTFLEHNKFKNNN